MLGWNNNVLIGFGLTMGLIVGYTAGMIAAPFWIEIDQLETGTKAPALIEGYGDIYGGLIGGILALLAAVIVYVATTTQRKRNQREMRAVFAGRIFHPARALLFSLETVQDLVKDDLERENLVSYCKNMSPAWQRGLEDLEREQPDPVLGPDLDDTYRAAVERVRSMLKGVHMLGEPALGVNKIFYTSFSLSYTLLKILNQKLSKIRDEAKD